MVMRVVFSLFLVLFVVAAEAQSTLIFKVEQPPPLVLNAGDNKTIVKGEQVVIGGISTTSGGSGEYEFLWTPSKGLDRTDIANPTAAPDSTTTYTLLVTDESGCTKSASITLTVEAVTGINDMGDERNFSIYPNPNNGTFFVTVGKELKQDPILLEIYNPLGNLVYKKTVEGNYRKLDINIMLDTHNKGFFFLRVSSHSINITRKVIVQ